jgi:hypothetical protein
MLVFDMDTQCIFFDIGTESVKIVEMKLRLLQLKMCNVEIHCVAA